MLRPDRSRVNRLIHELPVRPGTVDNSTSERLSRGPGRGSAGAGAAANWPAEGSSHDVDDLVDVALGIALFRRGSNTALDVILEDQHRQRVDRGPQGAGLLEDVHAVLLTLDHPRDAPDLALDPRQPAEELGLVLCVAVTERGRPVVSGHGRGGIVGRHGRAWLLRTGPARVAPAD